MKKTRIGVLAAFALAVTALTGCGGDSSSSTTTSAPPPAETSSEAAPPAAETVELTMSGWSLSTTPEFQVLVDAFHAANPDITITLKEYDANDYETLMLADIASGTAPDIITIKQAKFTSQWVDQGALADLSDVVAALPSNVSGASSYTVDGVNYGVPYRQDHWVLFYNKDLFDKAGVEYPDGSWTWDDYVTAAKALYAALGPDVKGTYEHSWQSTLQGFANTQSPGADPSLVLNGEDYSYMKPYYERALDLQDSGAQVMYGDISTNKLTYQGQFGKQTAAMLPMGTWYVATLIAQQASGDADTFNWGIAPIPQYDSSTTGTDKVPVTFGDPTGFGMNPKLDDTKAAAVKKFLAYAASEDAGAALAGIGILSCVSSDKVTTAYFAQSGIATDDLSKFSIATHKTGPENPTSTHIAAVQTALNDAHSAIMSESSSIDDALATALEAIKAELA
ncbi:MAG: extracellular solute-binding protein [Propionibacteriaceae bacterium]|jgi:multiple sugar transport system substrate-binding protein|nr:extracellular solute-binding protein [Propionibacteriaceae bacterium]